MEGFSTKDLKYDPKYVKWIFRMYGKKDNKQFEKMLDHHICTDEDYAKFSPINKSSSKLLTAVRESEERGFLCLDWDEEDFILHGRSGD